MLSLKLLRVHGLQHSHLIFRIKTPHRRHFVLATLLLCAPSGILWTIFPRPFSSNRTNAFFVCAVPRHPAAGWTIGIVLAWCFTTHRNVMT